MKDLIAFVVFYLVWGSSLHEAHPTAIPVLLTLYIACVINEIFIKFNTKTNL
jgi:hypothetical protein